MRDLLAVKAEIREDASPDGPDATGLRRWIELRAAACSVQY
jgi:hypothetical protein